MALTRKMLKAMGIGEEQIDQIIEAHADTVDALKEERDALKGKAQKLAGVQKELDDTKNSLTQPGTMMATKSNTTILSRSSTNSNRPQALRKHTRQRRRLIVKCYRPQGFPKNELTAF